MSETLQSYLVRLGFAVDQSSQAKFQGAIESTGKKVTSLVGNPTKGLIGDLMKLQFAFTGVFASLGAAFVGFVDKMGATNQEMRLGAMHALMSQEAYAKMNNALKTLGVTLDDLWDPKTRREFEQLWDDQGKMYKGAHQFSDQMEDIRFQFLRFENVLQGFAQTVASKVFESLGFGSGEFADQLARLNDYFISHFPEWSKEVSDVLVPALKDLWSIFKDIGEIGKEAWITFQQVIGALSNDDSLSGTAVSLQTIGATLKHVTEDAHSFLEVMLDLEKALGHFVLAMVDIGTGHFGAAGEQLRAAVSSVADSFKKANPGAGALIGGLAGGLAGGGGGSAGGAAIGGAIGALAGGGLADVLTIPLGTAIGGSVGGFLGTAGGGIGGAMAGAGLAGASAPSGWTSAIDHLSDIAKQIGDKTGIPPALIFGQLMHESNQGTNRGAKDLHNYSGVKLPGKDQYRDFGSDETYVDYLSRMYMDKRYSATGLLAAKNASEYASDLKKAGYYGDSVGNYTRGIERFSGEYREPSGVTIMGGVNVHVTQPNATPAQISDAVQTGVARAAAARDFSLTAHSAGVGQ